MHAAIILVSLRIDTVISTSGSELVPNCHILQLTIYHFIVFYVKLTLTLLTLLYCSHPLVPHLTRNFVFYRYALCFITHIGGCRQRKPICLIYRYNVTSITHARIQKVLSEGVHFLKRFFLSLVYEYHYTQAIISPPAKRHFNGVSLACG